MSVGRPRPQFVRRKPICVAPDASCGLSHQTWCVRRSGRCCWLTTLSESSCAPRPTKPDTIPTNSHLPARFGSSAARSPSRRIFPPEHRTTALQATTVKILEKLNTRLHRPNPHVVKRARHNSYRVKRSTDTGTKHNGPATVHLRQIA